MPAPPPPYGGPGYGGNGYGQPADPYSYGSPPSYPPPYAPPPASLYLQQPSPSYQYEYQRGGPAGSVYGCTGE
jgi:hypothetical protein